MTLLAFCWPLIGIIAALAVYWFNERAPNWNRMTPQPQPLTWEVLIACIAFGIVFGPFLLVFVLITGAVWLSYVASRWDWLKRPVFGSKRDAA